MDLLFYIIVICMAMFFLVGKITASNWFIHIILFIFCRFGAVLVIAYSIIHLAKMYNYIP